MKITPEQKKAIDEVYEHDKAQLDTWQEKLREAQEKVEYWKRQVEAGSIIATRATMDSWH